MFNLEKLVEDFFDDKNLSDTNLQAFTDDALLRLSIPDNNPGGIYSQLITDTLTKYSAFFGKMTNLASKKAISEGLTITMEATKKDVIDYLSDLQNLVKFKFNETSATYQEFYPQGMSEYHDANLPQLPTLLQRYVTAATAHLVSSNAAEVTALTDKVGAFNTARTAQLTAFGEVENLQTGRRQDRKALTLQLTTNLLTIAINNLENPDNFNNYYNPSYLPLTDKAFSVNGVIAPGAIISAVAEGTIIRSSTLTLYNQGTDELIFAISDRPEFIDEVNRLTIAPGNSQRIEGTLPVFEQYFLNIQNPHPTQNGKWKVVVG